MQSENSARSLHVLIAGAGIGGLTAAIALRQQGHNVDIFEQSKLSQETGAAIHLASNCNGLLQRIGIDAKSFGAVECTDVIEYLPHSGQMKYHIPAKRLGEKLWAHDWVLAMRTHLHKALREMALGIDGKGSPAKLHLASRVQSIDSANATITLQDGTTFSGDLVVGADGVHSKARAGIPGGDLKAFDSGKSAFRFMIPTEVLENDPETASFIKRNTLAMWIGDDRRMIMYPCQDPKGKAYQNFVAIHPSLESQMEAGEESDWQQTGSKDRLLTIYRGFDSSVKAIIGKAEDPKVWRLLDMAQIPSFYHDRLALLGDAAHPFLPHQGQGGGQAIEDAVALATLLPAGTVRADIPERLRLYNDCRYDRAHKIQEFTRLAGKDLSQLAAEGKKLDMMEYQKYNFGHDAYDFANNKLREHLASQDLTLRFRSPLGFGPSPGPRRPLGMHPSHSDIRRLRKMKPETSETISVSFKSSRTYLENLLPAGFAFTSPGTLAAASISCTTLDGMAWLGGGGYSHSGLYLHGVNYTKKDGSKIFGTYLAVLFENSADPIVTGREELGMPKLFCDITARADGNEASVILGWRGTRFGEIKVSGLSIVQPPMTNGEPPQSMPGPPPPPPEQGLLSHRYVPAVGKPGEADADYAVLIPHSQPGNGDKEAQALVTTTASVSFEERDWNSLPTLHIVAKGLADMPIYGIEEAKVVRAEGVNELSGAVRIE